MKTQSQEEKDIEKALKNDRRNKGYETFLPELEFRFKGSPRFIREFRKAPRDAQYDLLRVHKTFTDNHFIAYFFLLKNAGFPKVSIVQDEKNGYKALYKKMAKAVELKSPSTEIDPYVAKIFLDQFSLSFRLRGHRGGLTILYFMRGMYGDEPVREYLERRYNEAPKSTLTEMAAVIPHWEEIKKSPIFWAIEFYRSDVVEL